MITNLKPYPRYKDSGVPWLGKVPEHWEVLPGRTLFREINDRGHPNEELLSVTISHGVVRQADLLSDSSKKDSSNEDKSAYKLVEPGDIAYNKMRAWQGAVGVSAYRGIVSPAYIVQRLRNPRNSPRYIHYLLRTPSFTTEAERWSYGITSDQWSLRAEDFKNIYFSVPGSDEQTAIVRFLDWADHRIRRVMRARRRRIKLLEEYKQALINQAVTGKIDVRTCLRRGFGRQAGKPYPKYKDSGVPWLGEVPEHWEVRRLRQVALILVSNVDKHTKEGEIAVHLCNYLDVYKNERITTDIKFMRATASPDEIRRFRLRCGDVAITKDSEIWNDIGVPALVEYEAPDLVYGYHLAILRPYRNQLVGLYLLRALQSQGVAIQLHVAANGVTRFGLSHNAIKNAQIPLPPLSEQTAIVEFLDEQTERIDAAIAADRREIELLEEFHTRLVSDVVTGKLDVREAAAKFPDELSEKEAETLDEKETVGDDEVGGEADLEAVSEEVEI